VSLFQLIEQQDPGIPLLYILGRSLASSKTFLITTCVSPQHFTQLVKSAVLFPKLQYAHASAPRSVHLQGQATLCSLAPSPVPTAQLPSLKLNASSIDGLPPAAFARLNTILGVEHVGLHSAQSLYVPVVLWASHTVKGVCAAAQFQAQAAMR
jgi:hypothetical protein